MKYNYCAWDRKWIDYTITIGGYGCDWLMSLFLDLKVIGWGGICAWILLFLFRDDFRRLLILFWILGETCWILSMWLTGLLKEVVVILLLLGDCDVTGLIETECCPKFSCIDVGLERSSSVVTMLLALMGLLNGREDLLNGCSLRICEKFSDCLLIDGELLMIRIASLIVSLVLSGALASDLLLHLCYKWDAFCQVEYGGSW